MWSELDGAARDVVDVVHGRRGRSSAEPLGTWSTWPELDVAIWDVVDMVGVSSSGDVILILVVSAMGSTLDGWNTVDLVLE